VSELGREIEQARLDHGLTYLEVGLAAGLSRSQVSRVCRGVSPQLSIVQAARLLAVVGLELSARAYPAGPPIRDTAHLLLLGRLRSRLGAGLRWRTEVPLPISGDQRSWDACIEARDRQLPVEAETRPRDLQALERRLALKMRDGGFDDVLLLLSDTRHNRDLVRLGGPSLAARFPLSPRDVRHSLARGQVPAGSAVLFL
jgi:transcriptional regulator with XRE-family HTH domain